MRLRLLVALLAVTVAVLGACGGDDDDVSASDATTTTETHQDVEPAGDESECPLLETEVELNLHVEVASSDSIGDDGSACTYTLGDGSTIRIAVSEDGQTQREQFSEAVSDAETVELLGRDALWSPSASTLDVLDEDAAGIQISLEVTPDSGITDAKQAAIDLGGMVLAGR